MVFCFISMQAMEGKDEHSKRSYYVEYIAHPTTLLFTGIATFGGYCWYDSDIRTQICGWSKQQFEWLSQQFYALSPTAKWATGGIGFLGLYTACWFKRKAREEKKAHEDLKRDYESLKQDHTNVQAIYGRRIKFLEQKNEDNDKSHNFFDRSFLDMQADLKALQEKDKENELLKDDVLAILFKFKRKIKKLQRENLLGETDLPEIDSSDDEERIQSVVIKEIEGDNVKRNTPTIEHSLFPTATIQSWGWRLSNVEIIVGCDQVTGQLLSPRHKSHVDALKEKTGQLQNEVSQLKDKSDANERCNNYLIRLCRDNEEGIDDIVSYLKQKSGIDDDEGENSKRIAARFSKIGESPLDERDEKNLDSAHNLLQEKFPEGKQKRKTTT